MRRTIIFLIAVTFLCQIAVFPQKKQDAPQLGKADLKAVVGAMTTREKALLLVGMGMSSNIPGIPQPSAEDRAIPEKVPGAAGRTHAIKRLGIPSITLADGPAGVRISPTREGTEKKFYATAFPVASLLASSWNPELVNQVGQAFGEEVRDFGVDILLAPGMNIQRNPLGGRNFEYYSEDPLITGKMAAAFVNGVQSRGVGTSIKHFAVNNQEFNRMKSNSVVGERALREVYLKGFEIAVRDSQPWTVMSSYNLVNGTYASQSEALLEQTLRDEWGFKGFVMTDWFAGDNAVAQVEAGNEVIMPGLVPQLDAIIKAVDDGKLKEEVLDRAVERVLRIILRTPTFRGVKYDSAPDLATHAKIARRAATEGMVLLRNEDSALPMQKGARVALYGNSAYETISGGTGSGDVNEEHTVSVFEGLKEAGYFVDDLKKNEYEKYIASVRSRQGPSIPFFPKPPIPEMPVTSRIARQDATDNDLAVFVIGRNSGEFEDRKVADDFELSDSERKSLTAVSEEFQRAGKRFVVVLNIGGPIETASWREMADSILLAWQPGQEAGRAIVDVLSGDVDPSGRLAVTFPERYSDVPSSEVFPGKLIESDTPDSPGSAVFGKPAEALYREGIYVGYRYYTTFDVEPAYPFGFGLSYSTFKHADYRFKTDLKKGTADIRLSVTNTGKRSGRDVVEVYVGVPGGSKRALKAFAKSKVLDPGESEEFIFRLTPADLASFSTKDSAWIAKAGKYEVTAGGTSWGGGKSWSFSLAKDIVVRKTKKLPGPNKPLDELLAPARKAQPLIRLNY